MSTAVAKIKGDVLKSVLTMRYDPFLTDADWELVQEKSIITYPYKTDASDRQGLTYKLISSLTS